MLEKITEDVESLLKLRESLEVHQREQREKELIKELSKIDKKEDVKYKKNGI